MCWMIRIYTDRNAARVLSTASCNATVTGVVLVYVLPPCRGFILRLAYFCCASLAVFFCLGLVW